MIDDYAASFYGQIRAVLSSAVKRDLGEVGVWTIAKFLEDCREEFGHDKKLIVIVEPEQFGLREDDSPYLKHRQVEAGLALFRDYDRKRAAEIRQTMSALKASQKKGEVETGLTGKSARPRSRGPKRPKKARYNAGQCRTHSFPKHSETCLFGCFTSVAVLKPFQRYFPCEKGVWLGRELNPRHEDFQSSALPTELPSPNTAKRERMSAAGWSLCRILFRGQGASQAKLRGKSIA